MIKAGTSSEPPLRRPFSILDVDPAAGHVPALPEGGRARAAARWPTCAPGEVAQCLGPAGACPSPPPPRGREALLVAGGYGIAPFHLFCRGARARAGRAGAGLLRRAHRGRPADPRRLRRPRRAAGRRHRRRQPRPPRARHRAARRAPRRPRRPRSSSTPAAPTRCCTRWRGSPPAAACPAQVSLDPWMGCGVGTCLGCVVRMQSAGRRAAALPLRLHGGPGVRRARGGVAGRGRLRGARAPRSRRRAMSLAVDVGALRLKNPLIAASGTFGYGVEYEDVLDLSTLGGLVSKGLYLEPRDGCATPRIVETPSGPAERHRPAGRRRARLRRRRAARPRAPTTPPCSSTSAATPSTSTRRSRASLDDGRGRGRARDQHLLPQREEGRDGLRRRPEDDPRGRGRGAQGHAAARDPQALAQRRRHRACSRGSAEEAGADALSCINTLLGLAVDVERRRPRLAFGTGGLSGPAIRPIAVRMAWQAARAVKIPVIGIGGIASAEDALEFLIAGCRAVQVGTANFVDPGVYDRMLAGPRRVPRAARPRRHQRRGGHARLPAPPVAGAAGRMTAARPPHRRPRRARRRRGARAGSTAWPARSACSRWAASSSPPPAPTSCASWWPTDERVFLDLKFHDIPNTVAGAVAAAAGLGVSLLTVHAAGGRGHDRGGGGALARRRPPRVLAITVLTSHDAGTLDAIGMAGGVEGTVRGSPGWRADAGADGVVASPHEVARDPRRAAGRLPGRDAGHPARGRRPGRPVARRPPPAPRCAAGADYLVVGRPILGAADPAAAARAIVARDGGGHRGATVTRSSRRAAPPRPRCSA